MSMFSNTGTAAAMIGSVRERLQETFNTRPDSAGNLGSMLPGLLGAGALGGIAGALLTGKSMKKVAKGALTVGGGAAAGVLLWNIYKNWTSKPQPEAGRRAAAWHATGPEAFETFPAASPAVEPDGMLFLEAMVSAARVDGHIDAEEQRRIKAMVAQLYPGRNMDSIVQPLLSRPIDPAALAARVANPDEGRAVYMLSCLILDVDHFMERAYLDELAQCLDIDRAGQRQLEREVNAAEETLAAGAGS